MTKKAIWNTPPVIPDKVRRRTAVKVGPLAGMKTLNAREWKFVQEYVSNDGNMTLKEAAIRAGYKAHSASVTAWKLTNPDICPHVVAAIQAYRAELASKYNTTYERHMRDLQTIRDAALAAGAFSAAVQAEYRRGQALGTIYVERKEIRHGTIDQMSKEEVQKEAGRAQKALRRAAGAADRGHARRDSLQQRQGGRSKLRSRCRGPSPRHFRENRF